jgi:hypothetical protein
MHKEQNDQSRITIDFGQCWPNIPHRDETKDEDTRKYLHPEYCDTIHL